VGCLGTSLSGVMALKARQAGRDQHGGRGPRGNDEADG